MSDTTTDKPEFGNIYLGDTYDTPDNVPHALGDRLCLGGRWYFYWHNFDIFRRTGNLGKAGKLTREDQIRLSTGNMRLVEACGGTTAMRGEYPAWEYKEESALREVALEAYRRVYGGEARVEGIHAGLECGVFAEKIEGLDAISFGPDLRDVHSVRERLNAPSTARMYELVKEMLKIIAGK